MRRGRRGQSVSAAVALVLVVHSLVALSAPRVRAQCSQQCGATSANGIDLNACWENANEGQTALITCPLEDGWFGVVTNRCQGGSWQGAVGECSRDCVAHDDCRLFGDTGAFCIGDPKACACSTGYDGRLCETLAFVSCQFSTQCSGFEGMTVCADGYCCNRLCGGTCESCAISGTQGTCSSHDQEDPNDECDQYTCNGESACADRCTVSRGCDSGRRCIGGLYCKRDDRLLTSALLVSIASDADSVGRKDIRTAIADIANVDVERVMITGLLDAGSTIKFAVEADSDGAADEAPIDAFRSWWESSSTHILASTEVTNVEDFVDDPGTAPPGALGNDATNSDGAEEHSGIEWIDAAINFFGFPATVFYILAGVVLIAFILLCCLCLRMALGTCFGGYYYYYSSYEEDLKATKKERVKADKGRGRGGKSASRKSRGAASQRSRRRAPESSDDGTFACESSDDFAVPTDVSGSGSASASASVSAHTTPSSAASWSYDGGANETYASYDDGGSVDDGSLMDDGGYSGT